MLLGLAVTASLDDRLFHVPLNPGLTALYGLNGVGKTRLLRRLLAVFQSEWIISQDMNRLFYERGVVQADVAITPGDLDLALEDHVTRLAIDLAGLVRPSEATPEFLAIDWDDSIDRVAKSVDDVWGRLLHRAQSALGAIGAADHAERLLAEGKWLFAPDDDAARPEHNEGACQVYLGTCDHALLSDLLSQAPRPRWERGFREGRRSEAWRQMREESQEALIHGGDQRTLPALPEVVEPGLSPAAAIPLVRLGGLEFNPFALVSEEEAGDGRDDGVDLDVLTWRAASYGSHRSRVRRVTGRRDPEDPADAFGAVIEVPGARLAVDKPVVESLDRIEREANRLLGGFFDDAPLLRLRKGRSLDRPAVWTAVANNVSVSLRDLGDAHRRFAEFAIRRACAGGDRGSTMSTIAFIDEPERATHPTAARHVTATLKTLGDSVVVATHSPYALDQAENLIHLSRQDGDLVLETLPPPLDDVSANQAAKFGMSRADLLTLCRCIVLVEGPNDADVVRAWCGEEIGRARALIVPLGGTHGLSHVAETRWLVQATEAHFVVVIDAGAGANDIGKALHAARGASSPVEQHGARLRWFKNGEPTKERRMLDGLLQQAIDSRCLDRIDIFRFRKPDVARYLPVDEVLPGASDWRALERQFLAEQGKRQFGAGDGALFKRWVNDHGGRYSPVGIRQAARRVAQSWASGAGIGAERPSEFTDLARRILKASHSAGAAFS